MLSDRHLHFLQDKIQELRSALFFSLSNSVLRMPTSIITALRVDDAGQIWFFMGKPLQQLTEFDKQFPARLEFYKKGKASFIKVSGRACIVNDPHQVSELVTLSNEVAEKAMDQLVLVKLKIDKAEYFENAPATNGNVFQSVYNQILRWLLGDQGHYRHELLEPVY
ncbi:MAG TPA: pyridoxamine 5'-phosphate oxidase family protein [Flavitalea sp.]|nr:pyridoxamine 5'-phosphate oxidase family protein [Flavitalea sp.]